MLPSADCLKLLYFAEALVLSPIEWSLPTEQVQLGPGAWLLHDPVLMMVGSHGGIRTFKHSSTLLSTTLVARVRLADVNPRLSGLRMSQDQARESCQ